MKIMRFDIEKFGGITNFSLWQVRMTTLLIQNDIKKVITSKKSEGIEKLEWEELLKKL